MAGFITRWTVAGTAAERTITLPLHNEGVFNCVVNWGDGTADSTITTFDDADRIHEYAVDGTYDVEITGECPAWRFNNGGDKLKIVAVVNWGDAADFGGFVNLTVGFYGCSNLTSLGTGKIQAKAGLSNLYFTFHSCTNLVDMPAGVFDNCTNLSSNGFYATFYNCSSLTSVPAAVFKYNVSCITWAICFFGCSKLQLNKNIFYEDGEQTTRFLNKTVDFTQCFNRSSFTGVQGEAPDLWNCNFGTGSANPTSCFVGAGNSATSLSNYSEIPTTWAGPYGGLGYWTDRRDILQGLREEGVLRLYHDYRSGRVFDFSETGNNGVASAGTNFTKRGAIFKATTDEITVTDVASLRIGSGSIIVLGDFVSQVTNEGLYCRSNVSSIRLWLYVTASQLQISDGTVTRSLTWPITGKKCLSVSFTGGGTPQGYTDGVFFGNFSGILTPPTTAGTIVEIGNILNANKNNSQIKAVVVVSRAMTASEHSALYAQLENMVWPTKGLFPGAFMP